MQNPLFWAGYIQEVIIPHYEHLEKAFFEKVLPAFEAVESEAEQISNEKWERLIRQPGDPDDDDLSDLAGEAIEEGVSYHIIMMDIRQGLLNNFAVGIWHLFEQHLLVIHRRELLKPHEENDEKLLKLCEITKRLKQNGIDIEKFLSWDKLDELRLVANTVKHTDGRSCAQLKKRRPEIFIPPGAHSDHFRINAPPPTQLLKPLAGEDFYLMPEEIRSYFKTVRDFWEELLEILRKDSRGI
ncbi:MAG: hypothetical protein KGZ57_09045 [Dethiobacter sp.]|nr:hypothetical protein [Dethiobacter sp.]